MAALWNLQCMDCHKGFSHVHCSMYSIPSCPDCGGERRLAPSGSQAASQMFPFTVPHVDGKPMTITDIGHLRRVERDYGVVFSAFSKNNIKDLDPIRDLPTYRDHEDPRNR